MCATEWSELGVSGLPTGTVTLLLADVEGSTRLWESQADEMSAAIERLDCTLAELIAVHSGVRPVEQGEGDSFVLAFARASDAVACALALQRAPLAPIRLRIGVHTGEIQLRDEGNYIGPTINRTARLRDLAHGGQTVLSGTTHDLVVDRLPDEAWVTELGTHPLRDLPRPERVVQLCHSDIRNEFPPLRTASTTAIRNLPVQLTSFIGRDTEISDVRALLAENRLVTLTGAGGSGKTRLAVHLAAQVAGEYADGVTYVDLAPITHPDLTAVAAARALGLPDQLGRSATETVLRFIGDRCVLMVLDNCEHLLDPSATLIDALLAECPALKLLATSREPIGVAGEATWRVPSLSLADEAIALFADRARKVRPDFTITDDNASAVTEICRRLDGMPLAIELAAARMRALSVEEIVDSLHDRFRLLTGGARTAVRRQQTLRASVDWSHALLTEPERVLFRRLAAFMGGFDLNAAEAVGGGGDVERYQVLDEITLLVDKSLVATEDSAYGTRYRLLETVRQYALEKLGESGEADWVRTRHRDHYQSKAALLDAPGRSGDDRLVDEMQADIDNLRSAFTWSRELSDVEAALNLASSLLPLWLQRGRIVEGLGWLEAALAGSVDGVDPPVRARALADEAMLQGWVGSTDAVGQVDEALEIARELGDPVLLARVLTARGCIIGHNAESPRPYFAEALELARATGDLWRMSQILGWLGYGSMMAGNPAQARAAAEEGRAFAERIGDRFVARQCRWALGLALVWHGDLVGAVAQFEGVKAEADAEHDSTWGTFAAASCGLPLALLGRLGAARAAAEAAIGPAGEITGILQGHAYYVLAVAALAQGDVAAAGKASERGWSLLSVQPDAAANCIELIAQVALARGDVAGAREMADDAVRVCADRPCFAMASLTIRTRIALVEDRFDEAEGYAHQALGQAVAAEAFLAVPDILECLAELAGKSGSQREAARLFGAAHAIRQRIGVVRFKVYDDGYERSVLSVREALGDDEFQSAWDEGAALSTEEAIAYVQRGRGERKRPSSGWASLTPTELGVARLVSDGLANKEIATRLFVSPRTVQTHLTHIYTKLGVTSRVQLAQEAARHG